LKNLLVLYGGKSNEHEVSCISAANVCENVDIEKYNLYKIGITKDGIWWLYNGSTESIRNGSWIDDKQNLVPAVISPCTVHHGFITFNKAAHTYEITYIDVVFPVLHGKNGEDGTMQGLLTIAGIPFVGCDTYSSAICMNKTASKILSEKFGIKSTPFIPVFKASRSKANEFIKEAGIKYPVFVKPQSGGSSVGITKVKTEDKLDAALDIAFIHDDCVIIEEGVTGKEIEVALFGTPDEVFASPCGEIIPGNEFYDYDNKYKEDTAQYFAPARLDAKISDEVRKQARTVFKACGCSGLSRCDFFVNDNGEVLFNEINNIPGFTQISMYGKLLILAGYSFSSIIDKLIEIALK